MPLPPLVGILAALQEKMSPEERSLLFGQTPGGAATHNPLAYPNRLAPLLSLLENRGADSAMYQRNIMQVPAQPFGNIGINAWPFPGARLPNAYRGTLSPSGQPGLPDAPEYYVPGYTNQWLRGT